MNALPKRAGRICGVVEWKERRDVSSPESWA